MDRPTLASILEQSKKLSSSIQDPYNASPARGNGLAASASGYGYAPTSSAPSGYGLPSIELGLEQIEQQSRRLAARSAYAAQQPGLFASSGPSGFDAANREDEAAKAQYLLAQAQVDASALNRTLASLQPQNAFAPLQAHADNDISFLTRQAHQSILVDCVEQGRQETMRDFYTSLREDMFRDWEKQKQSIFEELGRHHPALLSNSEDPSSSSSPHRKLRKSTGYGNNATSASYLNQAASLGPGSELALHTKMMKYDTVIARLNECRKSTTSIGILTLLSDAMSQSNSGFSMGQTSDRALPLQDTYALLKYILGEKDCVGQQGEFVKDEKKVGQYASAYAIQGAEGKAGVEFRMQVAGGSKAFLEDQFMKHVEATLLKNPQQAELGGLPSNSHKIRAYVKIVYSLQSGGWNPILEVIGGQPIWARIFFLLRAGFTSDALACAQSKEFLSGINASEPNFMSYFEDWAQNGTLTKNNRERFLNEYNQKIRYLHPASSSNPLSGSSAADPFKLALYKIVGRADLNKRNIPGVTDKTEHWLWLQLALVHEQVENATSAAVNASSNTPRTDSYGLRDLANVLRKFGENHWDPKRDRPGLYFQVLLMSGQFERAVAFLYSRQAHRTDAVHFAIALAYYGLIKVPDSSRLAEMDYLTADMDTQGYEVCRLNFAKFLHRYYWSFVKADPTHALQYIALISLGTPENNAVKEDQKAIVADYIKELLVHSKAYAALLGELDTEGKKLPGAIPQNAGLLGVEDPKSWIKSIVGSVVTSADSNVSFNDIILLYNIAENYDSVIATLNSELGSSLSQPSQPNVQLNSTTASQDVLATAKSVLEHYEANGVRLNRNARETLQKLIKLKDAFGMFESGRLDDALVTFESVNLVPLQSEGDVVPIIKAADDFKTLDEAIVRNFDAILLFAMNILFSIHQQMKESPYGDISRQNRMTTVRTKARALMMFAGMLRYKLSAETYHQLSRQEVYLH